MNSIKSNGGGMYFRIRIFPFLLIISLLVSACGSSSNDSDTATRPPVTEPTTGQGEATEKPVDLTGLQPEPGDTMPWVDGDLLVYIPPGEFIMGDGQNDNPEHSVYLDGFWIYRTEVTNSMYRRCIAMGVCTPPIPDSAMLDIENLAVANLPVVNIRWEQAQEYCHFIGGNLPTEAQWEKAARGTDARIYPWGNSEPNCEMLNFNDCLGETSDVIAYPNAASPYKLLDMAGNIFEWVADWYQPNYYPEALFDNPRGPEAGEVHSVRGSAFHTGLDEVYSAKRSFLGPDEFRSDLGFRCVVEKAEKYAPSCEVLAYVPSEMTNGPGEPPGGSAACVVPEPVLEVVTYCDGKTRGNLISWTPADAEIKYSIREDIICSGYDEDTLLCQGIPGGSVLISACRSCPPPVVQLGMMATCDSPYVLDEPAGLCRYAGAPIPGAEECPPFFSLASVSESVCCRLQADSLFEYPVCPVGGKYDPVSRICWFTLPSTGDQKCVSQTVYFDSCDRSSGDGGGGGGAPGCLKYDRADDCRLHANEGCYWDWNRNICLGP